MAEYEHSLTIQAPPDTIFDYVSDVSNLPGYLPTVRSAEPLGTEAVRVHGESKGHAYTDEGSFRQIDSLRRLEWASGASSGYSGWLEVSPYGEDDSASARVTVHLTFGEGHAADAKRVEEGMRQALEAIRREMEGGDEQGQRRAA